MKTAKDGNNRQPARAGAPASWEEPGEGAPTLTRRSLVRQTAVAGSLAAALTSPAAYAPRAAAAAKQDAAKTFRYVDGTEPNSLDPPVGTGPFGHVVRALFEPLLDKNENLEPQPLLATDWSIGEDELTWTFNLKQGVTFHDGTDFTSDAVKYTFDRILDPEFAAGRRAVFTTIKEIVPDGPHVVKFVTHEKFPDLPFLLTDRNGAIVSPTAAEQAGAEEFGLKPVGTGPFQFVEWLPNDHITLRRFDGYHNGPATVDEVIFRAVPEASSREAMLLAGEVDFIFAPPNESVASLQENADLTVLVFDSLTQVNAEMRQTQPPFSVKEVRQAMNYAVDSQAIIDTIRNGLGSICDSPAPPDVWGAVKLEPYAYDPDRARELLAAGGYSDGFDGVLFYVSGRWAGDDQVFQALQAYWGQIGVNIEIQTIDMGSLSDALAVDPDERAGYIAGLIRTSTYLDYHLFRLFHSTSTFEAASQRSGYLNPEVDALLDQGRTTFVEEERLAAYEEAQRLIWDDAPFVWVFIRQDVAAHRAGVSGFVLQRDGELLFKDIQV